MLKGTEGKYTQRPTGLRRLEFQEVDEPSSSFCLFKPDRKPAPYINFSEKFKKNGLLRVDYSMLWLWSIGQPNPKRANNNFLVQAYLCLK